MIFPRRACPVIADHITNNSTGSFHSLLRRPRRLSQHVCMIPLQLHCARRTFLVRFQETPNESCYKFFVDDVKFLPEKQDGTLSFDLDNSYQSPLADQLLRNLPMVEEVTVGRNFVTVRRVDNDDADAAVRYFAMKMGLASTYTSAAEQREAAAQRSAELQQRVMEAMREGEPNETPVFSSSPSSSSNNNSSNSNSSQEQKGSNTHNSENKEADKQSQQQQQQKKKKRRSRRKKRG
ncbi:uncharacterized protein TM35_000082980 [Trypanosoma theileri]|uniref:Scaffold protein Nfu/NifU N-terminal domain-containing protein n=1 Tax=Trypanosoma theileri TaxID=67003 RepID=A0A1X0P279_9TRYP|nr:uncharacterized protein TM35_000082980 [Trypanosoma theileri]ORC90500.1 hypothetical protein TM35_000082980 [Trypanosoma theileri]